VCSLLLLLLLLLHAQCSECWVLLVHHTRPRCCTVPRQLEVVAASQGSVGSGASNVLPRVLSVQYGVPGYLASSLSEARYVTASLPVASHCLRAACLAGAWRLAPSPCGVCVRRARASLPLASLTAHGEAAPLVAKVAHRATPCASLLAGDRWIPRLGLAGWLPLPSPAIQSTTTRGTSPPPMLQRRCSSGAA